MKPFSTPPTPGSCGSVIESNYWGMKCRDGSSYKEVSISEYWQEESIATTALPHRRISVAVISAGMTGARFVWKGQSRTNEESKINLRVLLKFFVQGEN